MSDWKKKAKFTIPSIVVVCTIAGGFMYGWNIFSLVVLTAMMVHLILNGRTRYENIHVGDEMIHTSKLASIGQLAAGVGHEINNPLTIIIGNLELMKMYLEKEPPQLERFDSMIDKQMRAANRIADIVNNLRMFARIDDEVSSFCIHDSIQEVIHMLSRILKVEHINLVIDFSANSNVVHGQMGRFQQVIVNLINNAKDATESVEQPEITISTHNKDGMVIIQVSDNGPGIPVEQRRKVFEPFYTTKGREKGTGLGLGISQSIVNDLKGTIELDEKVSIGATFLIKLPVGQESKNEVDIVDENELTVEGKVLVVDDENDIREILCDYLREVGFQVFVSASAEDALKMIAESNYDLVLTDMKMGKMNGVELIDQIKIDGYKGKAILMTGEDYVADETKSHQPDDILLKPFSRPTVIDAIVINLLNSSDPSEISEKEGQLIF